MKKTSYGNEIFNNSRTNQATALKFCLRLLRVLLNISWKFGSFSIVRSRFTRGHHHRFFGLRRRLNNSRTNQATALRFCLRLFRDLRNISWKFGTFSIFRSRFTRGHHHRFFGLRRHLNNSRRNQATVFKFCLRLVQVFINIFWKFGAFSILCLSFIRGHLHSFLGSIHG